MWNCQHVCLKQPPSPSPKPARSIWHHTRAHTYKHCMRQHLGQVSSSYVPDGVSPSIMLAPSISLSLSRTHTLITSIPQACWKLWALKTIFASPLLFFAFVGAERDAAAHTWLGRRGVGKQSERAHSALENRPSVSRWQRFKMGSNVSASSSTPWVRVCFYPCEDRSVVTSPYLFKALPGGWRVSSPKLQRHVFILSILPLLDDSPI